jgi:myo-inositol-1(or 4)-monophosphatase
MAELDPHHLLDRAVIAARAGAELAAQWRKRGIGTVDTKSTDTDLVTAADHAVEALLSELLLTGHPDDRLLGEESGESGRGEGASVTEDTDRSVTAGGAEPPATAEGAESPTPAEGVRWIVDPIDGTVNYVYGLPLYAVSVAAEVAGQVLAGVVVNAATGEEWTAVRGGGAWRSGVRLNCSTEETMQRALVATGFGYDAARRAHQATVLTRVLPLVRDIRRLGAAALDLCAAAEGWVDAYFEKGLNPWDHAAGGLVATEAGLLVTGLRGQPPGPAMVVAAPPALHRQLHDLLVEMQADGGP